MFLKVVADTSFYWDLWSKNRCSHLSVSSCLFCLQQAVLHLFVHVLMHERWSGQVLHLLQR